MILYTSDNRLKRHLIIQIAVTIFLAFTGAVYEVFSFGVYSYFMIYAFAFPLVMGVLPYAVMLIKNRDPGSVFINLWNSAIAVFSVGSLFKGILDIYGTSNSLNIIYLIAGILLMIAAIVSVVIKKRKPLNSGKNYASR